MLLSACGSTDPEAVSTGAGAAEQGSTGDAAEFASRLSNLPILSIVDVSWPEATPEGLATFGSPTLVAQGTLSEVRLAEEAQSVCLHDEEELPCLENWNLEIVVETQQTWSTSAEPVDRVTFPITLTSGLPAAERGPYDPDPMAEAREHADALVSHAPIGAPTVVYAAPPAAGSTYQWELTSLSSLVVGVDEGVVMARPDESQVTADTALEDYVQTAESTLG